MTDVMEAGSGPASGVRQPGEGGPGLGRSGRMSRQRKVAAVLRLLRGEDLELVSRSLGVTAATLSGWREAFLGGGEAALATKPGDAKDLELDRLKAKLGEVVLERELADGREDRRPGGRPPFGPPEARR